MRQASGTFRSAVDTELFYQCWQPAGEAVASLAIVHGFGEHSGRYMNVVNHLVPRGYAVYGFDLRGHGRSPGQRGHITAWADYRQDVAAFLRMVAQSGVASTLFLMGHSMGGLIVLDYALRSPDGLRGVIASGPPLGEIGVSPLMVTLSQVLARVWPAFSMDTRLDATAISRIPDVVQAYRKDPLVHSMGSARLGTEMSATRAWVNAHVRELRLPLLLIQGSADRLVDPRAGRHFFDFVPNADKERLVYEGACHEVHNDSCAAQMLADLERWLEQHRV